MRSTEGLSYTGVRKAKGERDVQFLSTDALRLGQISHKVCDPVLKLVPSGSSPEVFRSKSRPMSPEESSVSDSSLVASQSSKKQSAFAWPCKE